ncbi:MAG: hypothetical protein E7062_04760, partial [Spirochaetaceae bacterium]|nr:hypothetical protein [Spirochaetaceae bacterium]
MAIAIVQPLYSKVVETFQNVYYSTFSSFEETFGVTLHYEKMSPSILKGLSFSKVEVIEKDTQEVVLEIDKANLSYTLKNVLTGNFAQFFDCLTVSGVNFSFNTDKNRQILEKILAFAHKHPTVDTGEKKEGNTDTFSFSLPFAINLKDINISYESQDARCVAVIKNALLQENKNSLLSLTSSAIGLTLDFFRFPKEFAHFDGLVSLKIQLGEKLQNTGAQIKVKALSNEYFTCLPFQFVANYTDDKFLCNLIKYDSSLDFSFFFEPKKNQLGFTILADEFSPYDIISVNAKDTLLADFVGSYISGNFQFVYDYKLAHFDYVVDGEIFGKSQQLKKNVLLTTAFSGTQDILVFDTFKVFSPELDITYEGIINLAQICPEGILSLHKIALQNENTIAGEIYFEPINSGFLCFMPQLSFGEATFSALQLKVFPNATSIDFNFELSDYSHYEIGSPGKTLASGSYELGQQPFVQVALEFENFYLESLMHTVHYFLKEEQAKDFQPFIKTVAPYVTSNALYFSTDFSSFSLNVPYTFVTSTVKEKEFALLSFSMNESALQINQCDIVYNDYSLYTQGQVEYAKNFNDVIFSLSCSLNSIPYDFAGSFVKNTHFLVTGNYGLNCFVDLSNKKFLTGNLVTQNLPLSLTKNIVALSANVDFNFENFEKWEVALQNLHVSEPSNLWTLTPQLSLAGNFTAQGGKFTNIVYSDKVSTVTGSGTFFLDYSTEILRSFNITLGLSDVLGKETYSLQGNAVNSSEKGFTQIAFLKDIFFDVQFSGQGFPLERLMANQEKENKTSLQLSLLGTLENPNISVFVQDFGLTLGNTTLFAQGLFSLDDGKVLCNETNVSFGTTKLNNIQGNFDIKTFSGDISSNLEALYGNEKITTGITLNIASSEVLDKVTIPRFFSLVLETSEIDGSAFGKAKPVSFVINREINQFTFLGGYDNAISGFYKDSGEVSLDLKNPFFLNLHGEGTISAEKLDVTLYDVYGDLSKISPFVAFPSFSLESGILLGSAHIGGLLTDPEFTSNLWVKDFKFTVPDFLSESLVAHEVVIQSEGSTLFFDTDTVRSLNGEEKVFCSLDFILDRWLFDSLVLEIKTLEDSAIKAHVSLPYLVVDGNVSCVLNLDIKLDSILVTGSLNVDNAVGVIPLSFQVGEPNPNYYTYIDLDITLGNKPQVLCPTKNNPILSALLVPQTKMKAKYDSYQNDFEFMSDLRIRGGKIAYIGRNFYLKEGKILFNEK